MLFAGYKADLMIDTSVWPEFRVDGTHSLKLANHIFIGCGLMRAPGRVLITAEEEIWDTGEATLMVHMTSHGVTSWLIPQEHISLDLCFPNARKTRKDIFHFFVLACLLLAYTVLSPRHPLACECSHYTTASPTRLG